ncbi:hypothetical protein [Elioraea sp.]|uniref:hypothetical protein n=1 Tax=Elioraea sp. TaxID=2185103 RepID=UPI0025B892F0|nr:hypothetical protein [Elioraea sp.]
MSKLFATAFAAAALLVGASPAFASAEAPVAGQARPIVAAQHVGGHGDAQPRFVTAAPAVAQGPAVQVVTDGQRFDVIPLALAGQAGSRG